jgi:hypothetical protein
MRIYISDNLYFSSCILCAYVRANTFSVFKILDFKIGFMSLLLSPYYFVSEILSLNPNFVN